MEIAGCSYQSGEPVLVRVAAGRIAAIEPLPTSGTDDLPVIAPGFVDLQVNGYGGRDFTSRALTTDDVARISAGLARHGVTGYLATITTQSFATIEHAVRTIDAACREQSDIAQRLWGIHVEGPYISPEDGPRGAHPRAHCRAPDWEEFCRWQAAARGRIKLVTLSPEYDAAPAFIRRAAASGVLVAIGHTAANSEQIAAAVAVGAKMSTHLGNGAHPQIRRHPNYIWDQLADDRLAASIIADGHHLPPAVVKCFLRAKTAERIVLVSDMTGMGGMPPGRYSSSLGDVEVLENGKLVVAGQRDLLAGAALSIEHGLGNVMQFAGVDLRTAVDMASVQPARLIGREHGLFVGAAADLVLLRLAGKNGGPLQVVGTITGGQADEWVA